MSSEEETLGFFIAGVFALTVLLAMTTGFFFFVSVLIRLAGELFLATFVPFFPTWLLLLVPLGFRSIPAGISTRLTEYTTPSKRLVGIASGTNRIAEKTAT